MFVVGGHVGGCAVVAVAEDVGGAVGSLVLVEEG